MEVTEQIRLFALDVEHRGARHGHELGRWFQARVVLEEKPAELPAAAADDTAKLMVRCQRCEAWAAILTTDGVTANAPAFDRPCEPAPPLPQAA